ncbi:non-ribosomal peptide synthetase [Thermobifida cellulosilytica]|uniref:Thioester reductase n=1 Tax=Thermobifida cellulosilytica TB100 TaxID=665004 RepID=A0A147KHP6_THECS|nr:non-ribosomal peptide synthetase [Thermobifida cellulosilytica]KUP96817.1 thioester reductase [Thermobifida cellulosilytica TB100]
MTQDNTAISEVLPLSPLQEGLLFHHALTGEAGDVYAVQCRITLHGRLDRDRLRRAAQALLRRYPNLRAGFAHEGLDQPVQFVPADAEAEWRQTGPDGHGVAATAARVAERELARGFDLAAPPLLRFALVADDTEHVLVVTAHHILLDGWSLPLLVDELCALYAVDGDPAALPPAPAYRDHLAWLARLDRTAAEAAWRRALAGLPGPCLVAPDRPVGARPPRRLVRPLGAALSERLRRTARAHRVTPNTLFQAAWAVALAARTGGDDVVFGQPVSGRSPEVAGSESMIGLFTNTLPVRVRLEARETAAALLRRIHAEQADLVDHHALGLAAVQRAAGAAALFDTLLVVESFPLDRSRHAADHAGLRVADVEVRDATHYPLALVALPEEEIVLRLDHDPDRIAEEDAAALLDLVVRVLTQLADTPERPLSALDLLGERERAALAEHNATARPLSAATLTALLDTAAAAHAERTAVVADDARLTYRELHDRAGRIAALLAADGVGAGDVVAVALPRSADLVAALLGVLRAGAAYLPLDLDHPPARLAAMAGRARAAATLTCRSALPHLGEDLPGTVVLDDPGVRARLAGSAPAATADVHPDQLAYVIFTSGSTGEPKGVGVAHRAVANRLQWMQHAYRLTPDDRVAHKTPVGFDVSVWELFWPLTVGATMVVARPGGHRDPAYLAALFDEQQVSVCHFVPSLLRAFLDEPTAGRAACLRRVVVSGEALDADLARAFARTLPDTCLENLYGPTEAAVDVTHHPVVGPHAGPVGETVPIGRPVWNTELHVLDAALRPLPAGAVGELYLGGVQLARGYVGRPDLTAARFVANPFGPPGSRLYRTGDLVRRRHDGAVEYLGRTDDQVKINGVRLEPGEVEAALRARPGVADAAVAVRSAPAGGVRLVGYVVPDGTPPAAADLRAALAETLPPALVPAVFVHLDALPLSVNGKLDRAALPDPDPEEPQEGRAPRTPAETALCTAFAEVLGLERVAADADFFALGGDSVSSLRLVGRLVRDGIELTVRDVFTHRTPERLARAARPAAPPEPQPEEPTGGEFADLMSPDEFADLARNWREQD